MHRESLIDHGVVAVDGRGSILVIDGDNHCIQIFKGDGKFLTAVGQKGNKHLEFAYPTNVCINHRNRKVYICDRQNHRIHADAECRLDVLQ